MAGTRPRSKKQEKTRVREGVDFAALSGCKLHQNPGLGIDRLTRVIRHPYLTVDDDEPGPLVDLVVLQHLPGRQAGQEAGLTVALGRLLSSGARPQGCARRRRVHATRMKKPTMKAARIR